MIQAVRDISIVTLDLFFSTLNQNSVTDCLIDHLVYLLFKFLSRLPLFFLHVLGTIAGWVVWLCSPTYRRHLHENMTLALGANEAKRLRGEAIAHAGKAALELPKIWMRPLNEVSRMVVEVSGLDAANAALQRGKGVVYLTPHLGCFEISAQYLSTQMPITVLYRSPRQAWLEDLIKIGRTREHMHLAQANLSGVRALFKALKRGESVGLLPDQTPRAGEGLWLDFFGRPAYTMTLAARLAESGAAVILVVAIRLPGSRGFRLHLSEPSTPILGSTEACAQAINQEMERLIRMCPAQYLWGYNRYKRPSGAEPSPEFSTISK